MQPQRHSFIIHALRSLLETDPVATMLAVIIFEKEIPMLAITNF